MQSRWDSAGFDDPDTCSIDGGDGVYLAEETIYDIIQKHGIE